MRIRVRIDVSNPLPRGFMLKAPEIEGDYWITIRYERLPEFCFNCGCIGHVIKECLMIEGNSEPDWSNMEFGGWLKFQGIGWMRRKESPTRNANGGKDDGIQAGTSKTGKEQEGNEVRGLEPMESIVPISLEAREDINEVERVKKGKGKMVDLNELSTDVMENEDTELDLMCCVEKMNNDDSPCGSTTEGMLGRSEVSVRKKMSWKRQARLTQMSEPLPSKEKDVGLTKKRKEADALVSKGKRSRSEGCDGVEVSRGPDFLAAAAKRPCQGS